MLQRAASYAELYDNFRWRIPPRYNIGVDVVDRHAAANGDGLALIHDLGDGIVRRYTFRQIKQWSGRFAAALRRLGVGRGDRVAILLPQSPEPAVAHVATSKLGPAPVPLV